MPTLVRGFKRDCERIVESLRDELRLPIFSPIDFTALAVSLDIPLMSLGDLILKCDVPCDDELIEQIYRGVSAFTVFVGPHRTIVYNERHAPPRHRSNLAHELAHGLLIHPPHDGCENRLHENEAAWLAGVLLLTDRQAVHVVASRASQHDATFRYGISTQMLMYRLRVTAAFRRAGYHSLPT